MKQYTKTKIILTLIAVALLATGSYKVYAQSVPVAPQKVETITISPASLKLNLKPGEITEGTLQVFNDSDTQLSFAVGIFDFVVTDSKGTPEVLPVGTISNNRYSAANWIAPSTDSFVIPAHEKYALKYYIKVPGNAGPGGHYAAIVYQPVRVGNLKGSGAGIQAQIATLVYFDVPGPIKESATITKFTAPGFSEYGPVDIATSIRNDGDLLANPQATITVKDMLGRTVSTLPLDNRNIFPGGIVLDYNNFFGQRYMFGPFTATFNGVYGRGNNLPLTAAVSFWVLPWKLLVVLALVVVTIVLVIMLMKKKTPVQPQKESEPNAEKPSEE